MHTDAYARSYERHEQRRAHTRNVFSYSYRAGSPINGAPAIRLQPLIWLLLKGSAMSRRVCSPPYTGGRHRPLHSLWRCTRVLRTRLRSSIVPGGQEEQVHSLSVRPQPSKRRANARTLACAYRTPRLPTLPLHEAVWPRTRNSAEARVCARREGVACPFSLRQNFTAQSQPGRVPRTWAGLQTVKRILSLRDGTSRRVSPGPSWPHAP